MLARISLVVFLLVPFLVVFFKSSLENLYIWQIKEYRFDRFFSYLKYEKKQLKSDIVKKLLKYALFTLIIIFCISPLSYALTAGPLTAFVLYTVEFYHVIQLIVSKEVVRPGFKSIRNILIITMLAGIYFTIIFIFIYWVIRLTGFSETADRGSWAETAVINILPYKDADLIIYPLDFFILNISLLIGIGMDLVSSAFLMLAVIITAPFSYFKRKSSIMQAIALVKKNPNLKVIAVTGSYGKSTTKELIYQLLKKKFRVIKTEKNNNTDIGIALTVKKSLKKDTEVFVCEMGAYKVGEILDCCKVVKPDIGIITGIDKQHLSLYGGMQQIMESSYEIVTELKEGGLLIVNGDNKYCMEIASKTNRRKAIYSKKLKQSMPGDILFQKVKHSKKGLDFEVMYKKQSYNMSANIQAEYNIGNLMAAILTALELGIDIKEIAGIVNTTDFKVPYLNMIKGSRGAVLIDDGYNIDPTGFSAALDYLETIRTRGNKWIITQGIIELGPEKSEHYQELSKKIITVASGLITTDEDLVKEIIKHSAKYNVCHISSINQLNEMYKKMINKGDYVLIEGPIPDKVYNKLKS